MLRVSARHMGLRVSKTARAPPDRLLYSKKGPMSSYAWRMRYPNYMYHQSDVTISDFFFNKWVELNLEYPCMVQIWQLNWLAIGGGTGFAVRQFLWNPDVWFREQEVFIPHPDRFRMWCYSLPYYNHRARNWSAKYVHEILIIEPDWKDEALAGCRPVREQSHRLSLIFNMFHWSQQYRYPPIEDPLYSSNSSKNYCRMYHNEGYRLDPRFSDTPFVDETPVAGIIEGGIPKLKPGLMYEVPNVGNTIEQHMAAKEREHATGEVFDDEVSPEIRRQRSRI